MLRGFFYSSGSQSVGYNNSIYCTKIDVTDSWQYRREMPSIFLVSFIAIFGIVILLNIVTSIFKKGGLLGGLI